jgi:hypothetical protein
MLDPCDAVSMPLAVATLLTATAGRSFSLLSSIGSLVDWALRLVWIGRGRR